MKVTFQVGGVSRTVRVRSEGGHIRVGVEDGEDVTIGYARQPDGTLRMWRTGDRDAAGATGRPQHIVESWHAAAAPGTADGKRQIWLDGRTLNVRRAAGSATALSDDVVALSTSIPAVVVEVLVSPGDRVEEGQKLLMLESMKMVIPIKAPHAGVVEAVHCEAGASVEPGRQLVELDGDRE